MEAKRLLMVMVPLAPTICYDYTVLSSVACPGDDTAYIFYETTGCGPPVEVANMCKIVYPVEDFRPPPLRCGVSGADPEFCIDPEWREPCEEPGADPVRCTTTGTTDEGGGETVDKPG